MEDNAVLSIGEILLTHSPNDVWASQVALVVKNLPENAGDLRDVGLIPGSGRSPGEGNGNPLQYPCLENPMGGGARKVLHSICQQVWKTQQWP